MAGAATAAVVSHTITLKPGKCKTVSRTLRICAGRGRTRTLTVKNNVTTTITNSVTTTRTVTTTPTPQVAFSDGTYVVGSQIVAGTYETVNPVTSGLCYWERLGGFGGTLEEIIANDDVFSGNTIVTISPSDAGFHSDGCGSWTKIG
jgi:hypothetical protein